MNISEIMGLADGSWVDEFNACVTDIVPLKAKSSGNEYHKCKLSDPQFPTVIIEATFFGRTNAFMYAQQGQIIHFSGQGMQKGSYKGTPQLTVSDKAAIVSVGASSTPVAQPQQGQAKPPAQGAQNNASKFHGKMKRMSLFMCHCVDYAQMINEKAFSGQMSEAQMQSTIASLFIEGSKSGIGAIAPAREAPKPAVDYDAIAKEQAAANAALQEKARLEACEAQAGQAATQEPAKDPEGVEFDSDVPF